MKKIRGYFANVAQAYRLGKTVDRLIGAKLLAITLVGIAVIVAGSMLTRGPVAVFWWLIGLPIILLLVTFIFGRKAEAGAYASIEGQPGAAAAVLQSLKGGWFTTPGVAFNKQQDLVHRVVNRRGVMLISEGPSSRVTALLTSERKRTQRFIGEHPIIEVQTGREPGQVPIPKLTKNLKKRKKQMAPAEVTELRRRLEALGSPQNKMPIPKGPVPRNARGARAMRR
jgi:hypothetical protein